MKLSRFSEKKNEARQKYQNILRRDPYKLGQMCLDQKSGFFRIVATCLDDFNTILIFPHHFLFFQIISHYPDSFTTVWMIKSSGKLHRVLKLSGKQEMIWKNLNTFETVRKMENDLEKSGQFQNHLDNWQSSRKTFRSVMFAIQSSNVSCSQNIQMLQGVQKTVPLIFFTIGKPGFAQFCSTTIITMCKTRFGNDSKWISKLCETRFSYGTPFHQILIKPSHQWRAYPHYRLFSEKRTIFCKWWSAYFCLHSKSCKKYLSKSPELYVNYIWMNIWIKCQLWLWHFYDTFSWDLVSSISFKAPHFLLLNIARIANAVQVTIWL